MKVRWLGEGSRVVETPVPLLSKSEKTGEVVCDPIGEFSDEDGTALIEIGGMFEAVDKIPVKRQPPPAEDEWDENGPLAARPPTDRPVKAFRTKGPASMFAKHQGFELRENPDSEKPFECWAPSPAEPEGAREGAAISA